MTPTTCSDLLTNAEAASYLRLAPGTLDVWRCTGRYSTLRFVRVGRSIRYRRADLDEWMESRSATQT